MQISKYNKCMINSKNYQKCLIINNLKLTIYIVNSNNYKNNAMIYIEDMISVKKL